MNHLLLYLASFFLTCWGIAHLFPTRNVLKNFGDITPDNQNIMLMEWINEGATLIFLGLLVLVITLTDPAQPVSKLVWLCVFIFLNSLSLISLLTGFRVKFLPFKLCPVIFTGSSILILLGGIV